MRAPAIHVDRILMLFLRYIRSQIPLDDLERRARFPPVDKYGKEVPSATRGHTVLVDQAGSHGQ